MSTITNVPCEACGRDDLPLHTNRQCPECFEPAPTVVSVPNDGTPAEKREAAVLLREMFDQYGVTAAIVNAERLEREAAEEDG